ncbi:hypothetical protein [Ruegeria meonggei]|uniref:Uncharacterized protein n=1 Tax=Ruegeria meonggei TaxID=1446476 RepID=A0A1X7ACC3_9RHOB|nr:hypothetical protein [Ruegeria meonggei]SLN75274.1 hypothetical protein RUM8411_04165 [Ruegeria meonggei]
MSKGEDRQTQGVRPSLFLERQSYRRRRLTDAARLLPVLGAALIAIPLLWPSGDAVQDGIPLSSAILYIFSCWVVLIAASLIFGFASRHKTANDDSEPESDRWQP